MAPEHELDPDTLGDHFDRLFRARRQVALTLAPPVD